MASQSVAHVRMRVINPHAPISSIANARLAEKIVERIAPSRDSRSRRMGSLRRCRDQVGAGCRRSEATVKFVARLGHSPPR
jgi:hypothetical protein